MQSFAKFRDEDAGEAGRLEADCHIRRHQCGAALREIGGAAVP